MKIKIGKIIKIIDDDCRFIETVSFNIKIQGNIYVIY